MRPLLALPAFVLLAVPTFAQDHSGHPGQAASVTAQTPATTAYEQANAKMHADMGVQYTGNADADFILGMIPHHQGAVDMARVVLEHGSNPEVREFAQKIIDAQEAEIAWMKAWLQANGY